MKSSFINIERTAPAFRLLLVGLIILASVATSAPTDPKLTALLAGYLAIAIVLWPLAPRVSQSNLAYPVALFDVGVTTAAIALSPDAPVPLWTLFLCALASALPSGRAPALIAGAASIAGYGITRFIFDNGLTAVNFWPVVLLSCSTSIVAASASRWREEQREKLHWQALCRAILSLYGPGEVGEAGVRVVEGIRRLLRAQYCGLWYVEGNRLQRGHQVGRGLSEPQAACVQSPDTLLKLEHNLVALKEFGGPFAKTSGLAIGLRHQDALRALLVATWPHHPRQYEQICERVEVFAAAAAEALVEARARSEASQSLRREASLRNLSSSLARTADPREARDAVLEACRQELGAPVSLVAFAQPHSNAEDRTRAATAPSRRIIELARSEAGSPADRTAPPRLVPLDEDLALAVWRAQVLGKEELVWLGQLSLLATSTFRRCRDHETLRISERSARLTLEAAPSPIGVYDEDGTELLANAALRALSPDPRSSRILEQGPDGEVVVGEPPRTFVIDRANVPGERRRLVVLRDVTEERDAIREKDDLIANIGHELRNPLSSIYGYSLLMGRQIGVVQHQVSRLNLLIADFLEASHRSGNRLPLKRRAVSLCDVAREAADRFLGAHPGRELCLEVEDVPPIQGDPERLGQVIDNLLGNAAKYSDEGTEIALTVATDGKEVTLSVQDQGIGIAADQLQRIFARFYRVHAMDATAPGTGLGLSIVRDLVTAHDGRVWAASAGPGLGSTFYASFPISQADGFQHAGSHTAA